MRVVEVLNSGSERLWLGVFNEKVTRQLLLDKVDRIEAYQIVDNFHQDFAPDGSHTVWVGGTVVGFINVEKPHGIDGIGS